MNICTPFRRDSNLDLSLMRTYKVNPIVSADTEKIWGVSNGSYGKLLDFSELDRQLTAAREFKHVHVHPVVNRSGNVKGGNPMALKDRIAELAIPVVDHCAGRVESITICQEMLTYKTLWPEIKAVYDWSKFRHPELGLYAGTHSVRGEADRLLCIEFCQYLGDSLDGFVVADYFEFSPKHRHVFSRLVEPVRALAMVASKDLSYLADFIDSLNMLGVRCAVETAVKASSDSDLVRLAQAQIYGQVATICRDHGADFWPWWISDEMAVDFINKGRRLHTGFFTATGDRRLSTKGVFEVS